MDVNLLIDNIVRQTTILVAQLATAAGGRAPLAHMAHQVFSDLVSELKGQGLGNRVIADMFGLTLRTYHERVRRASESKTDRGTSLWEAVLRHVREKQLTTRAELLHRFRADDEGTLRGVLSDLVESGLLFKSGRMDHTSYRAASEAEAAAILAQSSQDAVVPWLWAWLHQHGPATLAEMGEGLGLPTSTLDAALSELVVADKVRVVGEGLYQADQCVIPHGDELGWEAAVFDHYQAVVTAIANKVSQGRRRSGLGDHVGGSTYHFDLYSGHPSEAAVRGFLQSVRQRASALREEVERHTPSNETKEYRVVFYVGQNTASLHDNEGLEREGNES